jgi:hypothetical protein
MSRGKNLKILRAATLAGNQNLSSVYPGRLDFAGSEWSESGNFEEIFCATSC